MYSQSGACFFFLIFFSHVVVVVVVVVVVDVVGLVVGVCLCVAQVRTSTKRATGMGGGAIPHTESQDGTGEVGVWVWWVGRCRGLGGWVGGWVGLVGWCASREALREYVVRLVRESNARAYDLGRRERAITLILVTFCRNNFILKLEDVEFVW